MSDKEKINQSVFIITIRQVKEALNKGIVIWNSRYVIKSEWNLISHHWEIEFEDGSKKIIDKTWWYFSFYPNRSKK